MEGDQGGRGTSDAAASSSACLIQIVGIVGLANFDSAVSDSWPGCAAASAGLSSLELLPRHAELSARERPGPGCREPTYIDSELQTRRYSRSRQYKASFDRTSHVGS